MMERLIWSALITGCLWNIANLSELPQSSSQKTGMFSHVDSDRVSIVASQSID